MGLEADLKKFLGLPPYNDGGNIVRGDSYFMASIRGKYSADRIAETMKRLQEKPKGSIKPKTYNFPEPVSEADVLRRLKNFMLSQPTGQIEAEIAREVMDRAIRRAER